jgi:hypothetical protein
LPLAVSSALWISLGGPGRVPFSVRSHRLSSSSVFPPESYPVDPSRPAAADQPLSWAFGPFSTCQDRRSTCRELAALTSFRLQGLVTLLTAYSLRSLAGSVSHRQHSWDSPFGAYPPARYPTRFRTDGPTYRFSCRCSRVPKHRAGPTGRGSWVVTLPEDPIIRRWV